MFPAVYNNHLDLGKSSLLDKADYGKPDSIVYIDRLGAEYKQRKGFFYFYKYKSKKDDLSWKLAVVGLVPEDPKQFEFEDSVNLNIPRYNPLFFSFGSNRYDFTDFTETKIEKDLPVSDQLNKALKKLLYSRRNSARKFYEDNVYRTGVTDSAD